MSKNVALPELKTQSRKIRIMISSRCNDEFPQGSGVSLSDVRRQIKQAIETDDTFKIFGHSVFEVWINEEEPPQGGNWNSTDVCIRAVEECDLLICITNDNAGWAAQDSIMGICHVELQTGLRVAPSKVRLIRLAGDPPIPRDDVERDRNESFRAFLDQRNLFRGPERPSTYDSLVRIVRVALLDSLVKLTLSGVREAHRGSGLTGEALEWNRLQFTQRKDRMEQALRSAILSKANGHEFGGHVWVELGEKKVLTALHAIPDSLTVPEALELVGRPFLKDHEVASAFEDERIGPVHIIACFKNATESQARKNLGFPDATVVSQSFGIWVADSVQKVQFAFLTACTDEQSVRYAVQQLFEWLRNSGEDSLLVQRAESRSRIVHAISKEAILS